MKRVWFVFAVVLVVAAAERKVILSDGAKPAGPYSPGLLAGDFLYVTGQCARDASGNMPGTPEEQVRQSFRNIESIVKNAGLTMEHVVYTQVYLHSSVPYETMNKVWGEVFVKNPPGRATIGVHRMPTDTTVEINA